MLPGRGRDRVLSLVISLLHVQVLHYTTLPTYLPTPLNLIFKKIKVLIMIMVCVGLNEIEIGPSVPKEKCKIKL